MTRIGIYDPVGWFTPELLARIPGQVTRQSPATDANQHSTSTPSGMDSAGAWLRDKESFFAHIDVFVGMTAGFEAMSFMTTAVRHLLDDALSYVFLIGPANTLGMLAALGDPGERERLNMAVATGRLGVFDDRSALLEALETHLPT